MPWQDHAACAGADPELFDATTWDDPRTPHALQLCASCPVKKACLDYLEPARNAYDGIVGGMVWTNGQQARRHHRRARPTPPPPPPRDAWDLATLQARRDAEARALADARAAAPTPTPQSKLLAWAYPQLETLLRERYSPQHP